MVSYLLCRIHHEQVVTIPSGEEKPRCLNCERQGEMCDYSIRLNWGGRTKRETTKSCTDSGSSTANSPYQSTLSFEGTAPPLFPPRSPERPPPRRHLAQHGRSHSTPMSEPGFDPELVSHPGKQRTWVAASFLPNMQMQISHTQSHPILPTNALFDRRSPSQEPRVQPTSAPFNILEFSAPFDYPSPVATSYDIPSYTHASYPPGTTAQSMPPPVRSSAYPTPNTRPYVDSDPIAAHHSRSYSAESPATSEPYSPLPAPSQTYSPFGTMPLTPSSSVGVDEPTSRPSSKQAPSAYPPVDPRRLSVQSLLSGPPGDGGDRQYPMDSDDYTVYGYDVGLPDLDVPQNDDVNAIAIFSPPSGTMDIDGESRRTSVEPRGKDMAFEKGGYYASPVPIKISKSLEPLPPVSVYKARIVAE